MVPFCPLTYAVVQMMSCTPGLVRALKPIPESLPQMPSNSPPYPPGLSGIVTMLADLGRREPLQNK